MYLMIVVRSQTRLFQPGLLDFRPQNGSFAMQTSNNNTLVLTFKNFMKTTKHPTSLPCILCALICGMFPAIASAQTVEWIQQQGTEYADCCEGISVDGLGNVYIAGTTGGSLEGTSAGEQDVFLCKYDTTGTLLWTKQFGTDKDDACYGVSADGLGNVYFAGRTDGDFGGTYAGSTDLFLGKCNASGTLLWTRQLGTEYVDSCYAVSADSLGNVYISGATYGNLEGTKTGSDDAFVCKYDATGTLLWTRQFGTDKYDAGFNVSADGSGNVYVSGCTNGDLDGTNAGGGDAFIRKYNAEGTLLWTKQFGTSEDDTCDAWSDGSGNIYVTGTTQGDLGDTNAGNYDAFVGKYDATGTLLWIEQFGTSNFDSTCGVLTDSSDNIYVAGKTGGSLDGINAGYNDVFINKYSPSGTLLWTKQLGTSEDDSSSGISADSLGNIYMAGSTRGDFGDINAGWNDFFLAKITEVPEPSTLVLVLMGVVMLIWIKRRRR
ncbi:MAG: SBBP repeat-containing protein [Planctomycetia bacterium]|jgi:hypothetical protein